MSPLLKSKPTLKRVFSLRQYKPAGGRWQSNNDKCGKNWLSLGIFATKEILFYRHVYNRQLADSDAKNTPAKGRETQRRGNGGGGRSIKINGFSTSFQHLIIKLCVSLMDVHFHFGRV